MKSELEKLYDETKELARDLRQSLSTAMTDEYIVIEEIEKLIDARIKLYFAKMVLDE